MNAPRTGWRTTFPGLWLLVWPVLRCLLPSAAQVLAGSTLFPQVVVDPFPLDRQLHLRQRGHGGERYAAHRSAGVDVAAVEVQDTEIDAPPAQLVGEADHCSGFRSVHSKADVAGSGELQRASSLTEPWETLARLATALKDLDRSSRLFLISLALLALAGAALGVDSISDVVRDAIPAAG